MGSPRLLRKLAIDHCALECARPFDEVHRALVDSLPNLKPELSEILARGNKEQVEGARKNSPKLWLFLVRNHGELTAADGLTAKAMQYEIGNPPDSRADDAPCLGCRALRAVTSCALRVPVRAWCL